MRPTAPDQRTRGNASPATGASAASRHEIAEEHRLLRRTLERIERTAELGALVAELGELRTLLVEHFAREEAPEGLHRVIDTSAPHLMASVQGLFDEHRECLETLDRLTEEARACLEGPVADVRRELGELCRRLHAHEAAETELLSGALYDELGGGD
jgi:hypothetical protein